MGRKWVAENLFYDTHLLTIHIYEVNHYKQTLMFREIHHFLINYFFCLIIANLFVFVKYFEYLCVVFRRSEYEYRVEIRCKDNKKWAIKQIL